MSGIGRDAFRAALARFPSGVTVVSTVGADGKDYGMTVSAFASLSLDPPLVMAGIDRAATILPHLRSAEWFGVSMLSDHQARLAERFADQTVERFDGVAITRATEGPALIDGAVAHLVCRRVAEQPGGDHVILVGEVESAQVHADEPLLYALRRYGRFTPDATR